MARLKITAIIAAFSLTACGQSQAPNTSLEADGAIMTAAESYRDFGAWTAHVNAMVTDKLSAEIAAQYSIARSNSRAMLNVSIVHNDPPSGGTGMRAAVDVSARNLSGQVRNVTMHEIVEESAVYYIGETAISNAETLVFTISITPEGDSTQTLRYMQQFFTD